MAGSKLGRFIKHRLWDERDARRVLPADALTRLAERIAASEQHHSGQIRICVEASLPLRYLRLGASARERALTLFGKLGVWDTEHNNGVLIYLLLAEHAIEVVADRGLRAQDAAWPPLVERLSAALQAGRFEEGLNGAVDAAGGVLQSEFPRAAGMPGGNELPNEVIVL
jgi:uncharacterized membrane protein